MSEGHSQYCLNPVCGKPVGAKRKHAAIKVYCSQDCRQQASIIRRAGELLAAVGDEEAIRILRRVAA